MIRPGASFRQGGEAGEDRTGVVACASANRHDLCQPLLPRDLRNKGFLRRLPIQVRKDKKGEGMKKVMIVGLTAGLMSLAACNSSPREQAADNVEANAEAVADNLEEAADNATTDAAEDQLENRADAVRATGQNQADDLRTNDADTNLSNGI